MAVDPSYWDTNNGGVDVMIAWDLPADDFDLYIYQNGSQVDHSANGETTSEDVFPDVPTHLLATGAPVVDGALACFDCSIATTFDSGDHITGSFDAANCAGLSTYVNASTHTCT